jgi:hypothetical protein
MIKKPIDLCLELKGEDAVQFQKYLENPDADTIDGRELMREAAKLARQKKLGDL